MRSHIRSFPQVRSIWNARWTLILLLATVVTATTLAQDTSREETAPNIAPNLGKPNSQYSDLLDGDLFNARFGQHRVRFGQPITAEVLVDHPTGNLVRGAWGRGVARVTQVDGQATDENQVTFFILRSQWSDESLIAGERYRLRGWICNGLAASQRASYSFQLLAAPELLPPDADEGETDRVLLDGFSFNRDGAAHIRSDAHELRLRNHPSWAASLLNKAIRVSGIKHAEDQSVEVISMVFPKLDDLVGHEVELDGTMWSLNGHWWFEHADQEVIVSQLSKRPGADLVSHGFAMRLKGQLAKELRPSLEQITLKTCRDLVPHFVLKDARIKLLSMDRAAFFFAEIPDSTPRFSDGVLDLHDESHRVYNVMPWMNHAQLLYGRNVDLIAEIMRRDSPTTRAVLKKRMQDAKRRFELRLLDAGMLAALNDEAGQTFLLSQAKAPEHHHMDSVYWVIGHLYQFAPIPEEPMRSVQQAEPEEEEPRPSAKTEVGPDGRVDMMPIISTLFHAPRSSRPLGKVDMRWSESLMIQSLVNSASVPIIDLLRSAPTPVPSATLAVRHGAFPELLVKMKSDHGIRQMCSLVATSDSPPESLVGALLHSDHSEVLVTAQALLRRQPDSSLRRMLQAFLMRHDRERAVDDLIDCLDQTYAFRALHRMGSDAVSEQLHDRIADLNGQKREQAELLRLLLSDEPTKKLLDELAREDGISRNLILYWLAQGTNLETARSVARLLKSAPADFLNEGEFSNTHAVQHAIDACRIDASRESIGLLISLLNADLDRFVLYTDPGDWNSYIAAHLIELTDVSFGVDQSQWQRWLANQPPP